MKCQNQVSTAGKKTRKVCAVTSILFAFRRNDMIFGLGKDLQYKEPKSDDCLETNKTSFASNSLTQ